MWPGGEKESYTTQQDSRGRFVGGGEGKGESERRDLWNGSGGKERGLLFMKGFGACARGLMMYSICALRDSSSYAQRVLLVTAVEDPKGGPV